MIKKIYPYRFILAFFILLLISMMYWSLDISLLQRDIASLTKTLNESTSQARLPAALVKSQPRHDESIVINEDNLQILTNAIESNHLFVRQLFISKISPDKTVFSAKITLEGSMKSVRALVNEMYKQRLIFSISDFTYQSIKNNLVRFGFQLEVLNEINHHAVSSSEAMNEFIHQPFCHDETSQVLEGNMDQAETTPYSLSDTRLMGWLQYRDHQAVLLLLPNGVLIEAVMGQVLGKEKGILIAISELKVQFKLPNQRILTLWV